MNICIEQKSKHMLYDLIRSKLKYLALQSMVCCNTLKNRYCNDETEGWWTAFAIIIT